jgi:serine/threonine-protein kinase
VLAGKYRVDRVLGVGGMGVVVAATHLQLQQTVALKFALKEALASNPAAIERFLREARAAVKLKSEHVAKVLDVGTLETGAPYMVMEYLDGADLGQVVQRQGALSVEASADYVLQACEALAEAHSLGIVHRDLKPQNLFLTQAVGGSALVKVLDFGISKMTMGVDSALTKTSSIMGSPLYMAPEQMRSARKADVRSDIWALGVILFELLTGEVPFNADTMPELCLKVVSDPPRAIAELRNDVPVGIVEAINKCLAKDPNDRYQNAAELASALEPFAPAASRNAAARARMVLSSEMTRQSMASSPSQPSPPVAQARTNNAAVTGGAQTISASPEKKKTPLAIYLAAGVGVVAIGGLIFAFTRASSTPAAAASGAATSSTPATTQSAATEPTTSEPTKPPPIASLADTASAPSASASATTTAPKIPTGVGPVTGPGTTGAPVSTDTGLPRTRH